MDVHVQNLMDQQSGRVDLQRKQIADHLTYWKKLLEGAPLLDLPTDYPHPTGKASRSARYSFELPQILSAALKAMSQDEGTGLFVTLLAAFNTLLFRYTGQNDLLVGNPNKERAQDSIGLTGDMSNRFLDPLILRANVADNLSFRTLLSRVGEIVSEAYTHQQMPIEHIAEALQQEQTSPAPPSVYQVMFALDESSSTGGEFALRSGENMPMVALVITAHSTRLRGWFEYNADLFHAATIARMAGHWQRLLEGIVSDPDQHIIDLPLLTDAEWQQQVVEWNMTQAEYPRDQVFHELFETQVDRTPEAVAVVFDQEQLTYRELNNRANQLAWLLQDLGVGPEMVVPLLAERGTAFLIAILAIFKAGGAYLPLDPHYPSARLRGILEHCGSNFILAGKDFAPELSQILQGLPTGVQPEVLYLEDCQFQDRQTEENLPRRMTPHNLAYVIYTSGSTGTPKGVMIEHRGMLNHIYAKIAALQLAAADSVAQTASQCFDISVWQFLSALLVGGSVHIFKDEVSHDPLRLLSETVRHQITILETVPSLLGAMLEAIEKGNNNLPRLEKLRWLIPTGEALPPEFCRRWLTAYPQIPLLNAYGPTECSDDVTHFPIYQPLSELLVHTPIGRPVNNMQLYILDEELRPVPIGVRGELYVGGVGVGRGYLNEPKRTAEAFVADPFSHEPGARLYKTGDLGRFLPDGNIEFLGRIDHQVKIRGYRIELGEIEALLRQHPDVHDVVVIAREETPGDKYLAAYIVASSGVTGTDLRNYVKERLPAYMVPAAFKLLAALPLTPNGKVDRRALPVPEHSRPELAESFVAPTTPVQQQLVEIWEELLEIRPIGIRDNFFDLGGHSLLAVRLIDRIEQIWGKKIAASTLLGGPTIERLSEELTVPVPSLSKDNRTGDVSGSRQNAPKRSFWSGLIGKRHQ